MATLVVNILASVVERIPQTKSLKGLKFYRNKGGARRSKVYYSIGNSVVVFRVKYRKVWYAMRCYSKSLNYLRDIYGEGYYPQELCVESPYMSHPEWIDVVMTPWEDGVPLSSEVTKAVSQKDQERLMLLSHNFNLMALDLLGCDWSHGDLSGENIIVTPEGDLRLIDFDSKYLPQFEGELNTQLGTRAYQSPNRTCEEFSRHTDDYSLALISTALKALSIEPTLCDIYPYADGLLYNPAEILRGDSKAFNYTKRLLLEMGLIASYRIAEFVESSEVRCPNILNYFETLTHMPDFEPMDRLQVSIHDGRYGYQDASSGEVVISHIYDEAFEFNDGIAATRVDNIWHFIDSCGLSQIFGGDLQEVGAFRGESCRVKRNDEWGLLFRDGKFVF